MTIDDDFVNSFLEHHGVKGQKWGVRRKRSTGSMSDDARAVAPYRGKPVHTLSNQQIKAVNERMNLEQNYNRLNPTKVASGRKRVTEILATIGVGVSIYNLLGSAAGKATADAGKRMLERRAIVKVAKKLSTSGPG